MAGIDSLYSVASSIGEKVYNSIQAGTNAITAGALDMAGYPSLKVQSKFQANDLAKVAGVNDSSSPEDAKKDRVKVSGALEFPSGMKHYTKFTFYEYDRSAVNVLPKLNMSKVFVLPMPANLQESFGVEYDSIALGPVLGAASNSVIAGIRNDTLPETLNLGDNYGKTAATAGGATALNMLKKASPETYAIGAKASGIAPNPGMAVIFSNIGLRTHSFNYKFAPTSERELKTLKTIITELKVRMLPGMLNDGSMLFTFPDVCDIEFGPDRKRPYTIKRCVMENMSVNYSPMGSPAFFKTGDPVMVEITMSFKEIDPFTRKDMGRGVHDFGDNQSQAETNRLANAGNNTPRPEINPRDRR